MRAKRQWSRRPARFPSWRRVVAKLRVVKVGQLNEVALTAGKDRLALLADVLG